MIRIFLAAAIFALSTLPVSAATYHVETTGNDSNSPTQAQNVTTAWLTPSHACSVATTPGDVIIIGAGAFTDNNRCNLAAGVAIQGAGTGSTIITSAYNGAYQTGYIYRVTSTPVTPVPHGNNVISGFTIDGSSKTLSAGIWLDGTDNITINNMQFKHIKSTAIRVAANNNWSSPVTTAPPAYGLNVSIHDIVIDDCTSQTTVTTNDRIGAIDLRALDGAQLYNVALNENYANHGTGLKDAQGWLKGFKMYNCNISTDHGNGDSFVIETYNFLGDAEIYNNTFNHYISLNGGVTSLLSGSTWNLKIHDNVLNMAGLSGSGHEFSHNWLNVYNNYFNGAGAPAAGIWLTGGLTATGVSHWRFNNNVVYNCSDGVFLSSGANSYVEIYNNVFDTMTATPWGGYGIDGSAFTGSLSGMNVKNNLFMNCTAGSYSFDGSITMTALSNNWLSSSSGPGITGSGARPATYYKPSGQASNLVDAGVVAVSGQTYSGTAPDIGAYEYTTPSSFSIYMLNSNGILVPLSIQ